MKNQFFFLVVPEKYEKYFTQLRAMHIMACILILVYTLFQFENWDANWMEIVSALPAVLAILVLAIFKTNFLKQVQVNQVLRIFEIGFLAMAASFFYEKQYWVAMILFGLVALFILMLLIIENKVFSERFIELNQNEITLPQMFFTKKISWDSIQNVVLRFHVLTLEMKDNTFVQQSVFHKYDEAELLQLTDFLNRQLR